LARWAWFLWALEWNAWDQADEGHRKPLGRPGAKSAPAELQKAKEAAESANRAKSEFLGQHEPWKFEPRSNGVLGMVELTKQTNLTARGNLIF